MDLTQTQIWDQSFLKLIKRKLFLKKVELIELCNKLNLHVDTKSTKTNLIEVIVTFLIPKDDHELLKEARKMHTAYLAKLDEYESGLLNGEVLPFPEF